MDVVDYNSDFKNAYGMFLEDIKKYKVLTQEEEQTLFTQLRNGDESAREVIANSNMRLVNKIARGYLNRGVSEMGLIEAGALGLAIAINKFDVNLGNKFSTYATNWIKQAILREISNTGSLIRIPINKIEKVKRYNRIVENLFAYGDFSTEEEALEAAGISKKEYDSIPQYTYVSTNTPVGEDGESTLESFIKDDSDIASQILEKKELKSIIDDALSTLSSKEETVIRLRTGFGCSKSCTLEEIGKVLGISRERVRQIESKSLRKIRKSKYYSILADYQFNDRCY